MCWPCSDVVSGGHFVGRWMFQPTNLPLASSAFAFRARCCRCCCHYCRCCCCYCCCCRSCCCSPCAFVPPLTASRTLACSLPRSARYLGQVAVDDAKGDTTVAEAARVIARIGARDPPAVFVLVSPSDVKVLLLLVHPTHHHRRCRHHCRHCCCMSHSTQ